MSRTRLIGTLSSISAGDHVNLEQARRDFKAQQPELYRYISAIESAKALDEAGDTASGAATPHGAANRIWALVAREKDQARRMREAGAVPGVTPEGEHEFYARPENQEPQGPAHRRRDSIEQARREGRQAAYALMEQMMQTYADEVGQLTAPDMKIRVQTYRQIAGVLRDLAGGQC